MNHEEFSKIFLFKSLAKEIFQGLITKGMIPNDGNIIPMS
jgi:hypothetical protein